MGLLIVIAAVLFCALAFALAWRLGARRAWGRGGWMHTPWWRRWAPAIAAVLYPLWIVTGQMAGDWIGLGQSMERFLIFMMSLPTLLLGVIVTVTARSWIIAAGSILAAGAAPLALVVFESGTHGRWYIRSEGLALLLSLLVGAVVWLICMAGSVLIWGVLAQPRRRRTTPRSDFCAECGYDLSGLSPSGGRVCPECGQRA